MSEPRVEFDKEKKAAFFRWEDVEIMVDRESLDHTLGCGEWGYGHGLVDEAPGSSWERIVEMLGLPTEPFSAQLAERVVKRTIQRAWLRAFRPKLLEDAIFSKRDQEALDTYRREHPRRAAQLIVEAAARKEREREEIAKGIRQPHKAPEKDNRHIVLLTEKNPKREGSSAHARFQLYFQHKTTKAFLEAGGSPADLRHDQEHGFIKLGESV